MTPGPHREPRGCPDAGALAAYVEGTLPDAEAAEIDGHLLDCPSCREVTAAAVPVAPGESDARAARRNLIVPAAVVALAAAAVLLLAVILPARWAARERVELLRLVSAHRPVEARLTTAPAWAPPPRITRDARGPADVPPDVRIAEAELEQWAGRDPSAANLHALGIGRLGVGDATGAVAALEQALARRDDARVRNDLAAALLEDGERQGDPVRLERARALLADVLREDPNHPEALFNAALAEESLGAADQAVAAWERYLARDAESPWAAEARDRLARLRSPAPR